MRTIRTVKQNGIIVFRNKFGVTPLPRDAMSAIDSSIRWQQRVRHVLPEIGERSPVQHNALQGGRHIPFWHRDEAALREAQTRLPAGTNDVLVRRAAKTHPTPLMTTPEPEEPQTGGSAKTRQMIVKAIRERV